MSTTDSTTDLSPKLPAMRLAIDSIVHALRELADNVAVIAGMDLDGGMDNGELRELLIALGDDIAELADCLARI